MKQSSWFARIAELLRKEAGGAAGRAAPAPVERHPDPVASAPAPASPPSPAAQPLASDAIAAGRFSFVGLGELRQALGGRWPALKTKVHAVAERVIERHLLKGDVFDRQDDETYIVLFAQLSLAEAEFKCRVISKEICERLLGEAAGQLKRIQTSVGTAPRAALTSASLRQEIGDLSKPSQASAAAPPHPREVSAGITVPLTSPRGGRDVRVERRPAYDGAGERPAIVWRDFEAGRSAREREGVSPPPKFVEPVWRYEPVWDAAEQRLAKFRLVDRSGARSSLTTDLLAFRKAAEDALQLSAFGRAVEVICPVHHSSLFETADGPDLLARLRGLPLQLRTLLTVEMVGYREKPWTGRAIQFSEALRSAGVAFWARSGFETTSIPLLHVHPSALIADSAPSAEGGGLLASFARRAGAIGCSAGLAGVLSEAGVRAAAESGMRYVSGPAMEKDIASLDQALQFEPMHV